MLDEQTYLVCCANAQAYVFGLENNLSTCLCFDRVYCQFLNLGGGLPCPLQAQRLQVTKTSLIAFAPCADALM